jgi:uncharacterized protein YneF (UPF0154 family)
MISKNYKIMKQELIKNPKLTAKQFSKILKGK